MEERYCREHQTFEEVPEQIQHLSDSCLFLQAWQKQHIRKWIRQNWQRNANTK
jgi:ribonuclease HI